MAKSKVDKDRKSKVQNFKENHKSKNKRMSTQTQSEAPQLKPIRQIPIWNAEDTFEITGAQFGVLNEFFKIFAEPMAVMQQIFGQNMNTGKITAKYLDENNEEIPVEEVNKIIEDYKAQFEKYQAETAENAATAENVPG